MRKTGVALLVSLLGIGHRASAQSSAGMAMPEVMVYKTKSNYRDLVPVMLSPDRSRVVSYPDPADLKTRGEYATPVSLHNGYLLDRRGVGWHTAFIKLTYEEYGKLATAPTPEELYKMIADKNPMTALYDCGRREPIVNMVRKLNEAIDEKKLKKKCTTVKDELQPAR